MQSLVVTAAFILGCQKKRAEEEAFPHRDTVLDWIKFIHVTKMIEHHHNSVIPMEIYMG